VQAILDGMHWLGRLIATKGHIFQMQRLHRYKEVADELLKSGSRLPTATRSKEELDANAEAQRLARRNARYERSLGATSKEKPPAGVIPVSAYSKTRLAEK
jgi:glutamyl-tRNA synthetase